MDNLACGVGSPRLLDTRTIVDLTYNVSKVQNKSVNGNYMYIIIHANLCAMYLY